MIRILNQKDEYVGVLSNDDSPYSCPYSEDKIKEKLNDSYMNIEFEVPADHEMAGFLVVENKVLIKDLDDVFQLFRIKIAEDKGEGDTKKRYVFAETEALELLSTWVRPTKLSGYTARQALDYVLSGSRWKSGIVEWSGLRTITFENYETSVAAIQTIRSVFTSDLRYRVTFDHNVIKERYVDLLERRGSDEGKRFEYGKDLKGVVKRESTEDLATALIGIGASKEDKTFVTFSSVLWTKANNGVDKPANQDWIGDDEALSRWGINGRHIVRVYRDDNETDPEKLLSKTWKQLQKQKNPLITFESSVVLLERLIGEFHEKTRLGDTVRIYDITYNPPLLIETRIEEMEWSLSDPDRDSVVMGDYQERFSTKYQALQDLQKIVQVNRGSWDAESKIYTSNVPPENPEPDTLWLDTSQTPNVLKRFDSGSNSWIKATPTQASEVGAETPQGAQEKAETEAGEALTSANDYTDQQIGVVNGDIEGVQDYVDTTFKDNVVQITDSNNYSSLLNDLSVQKKNVDNSHTETYSNGFLKDSTLKTDLYNKKVSLNTAYTNLTNAITSAQSDGLLTSTEKTNIDGLYSTYGTAFSQWTTSYQRASDNIVSNRASQAETNAKNYTDLGFEKKVYKQSTRPTGVSTGTLWLNTGEFPSRWYLYDPNNPNKDSFGWVVSGVNNLSQLAGQITQTQVADNFITSPMIGANAIIARHMAAESVTADKLEILAKSFIASPTKTEKTDHWSIYAGTGAFTVEPHADKGNRHVIRLNTSTDVSISHDMIPVDPSQNYKVAASMMTSSDVGTAYFGIYAYDKNGVMIDVMQFDVASRSYTTSTSNPYFWYGDSTGAWRYLEGYVMGSEATIDQIPTGLNVDRHFVMPSTAAYIKVRFLNYYNQGTNTDVFVYDPTMSRTDAGIISFDQAKGGELTLGGMDSKNGVLTVNDATGQEVARLDGSYGGFTELGIDVLKNTQNILFTTYDGLHNFDENVNKFYFYVDPQYGDDNNDGTEAFPLASLQSAIDRLPKVLNHHVLIYVRPTPLYYDDVIFVNGFMGVGSLTIDVWELSTRYVHFQSNGNNKNSGNHYNEIKVWTSDGSNRASGAGAAGRIVPHGTTAVVSNPDKITNGITTYGDYGEITGGLNTFQMYLGGIYTGLAHVHRWMYYNDGRYYKNTKIMVSDQTWDNANYKPYTIYDQDFEGTQTETSEGLIIPASRYKLIGRFAAQNNLCYIYIKNMVVDARKVPETNPFYFSKCIHANVNNSVLWCNPTNSSSYGYGMYSNNGSYVRATDCEVNNASNSAFLAAYGGNLEVVNSKGSNNLYNFYAFGTSYIGGGGTQPKIKSGTSYTRSSEYGQVFLDAAKDTYHVPTAGTYSPIAPPPPPPTSDPVAPIKTTYVETFISSGNCDSYDETNDGSISYGWRRDSSDVRQGKWDVWGNYRGCFFFGSNISNKVNGTTVKKVEVWLQRQSSGGSSSAVSVGIRAHNYSSRPSGQPATAGVQTSSFSLSQSKWVDCTSALKSYFASGYKGICLYTGSTSQYARMVNKCQVRITYEK